ncbi:MAG: putative quinol monooxygenase [Thermoleophilia bacterium]
MTVVLAVTWVAREGEGDAVAALLRQLTPLSRAEPGCLQYDAHRDPEEPNTFFLFERYADDDALAAHSGSAYFQELVLGQALPLLASRQRTTLTPLT